MDPKKVHRRQNDPVEIERTSVSVAIPRAHKLRIIPRSFAQKFGDCHPAVQSHAPFNATAWPALCSELRSTEATDTYSQSMPAGSRMGPPHIGARHTELCPGQRCQSGLAGSVISTDKQRCLPLVHRRPHISRPYQKHSRGPSAAMAFPRSRSYLAGEIQLIFSTQSWQRIDCVYVVFKGFSTTTIYLYIYIYIIFTYV